MILMLIFGGILATFSLVYLTHNHLVFCKTCDGKFYLCTYIAENFLLKCIQMKSASLKCITIIIQWWETCSYLQRVLSGKLDYETFIIYCEMMA